ncbi:DNA-processing protein DprA [Rhodoferax aquaticus]|uniref:DNA-protecting protein DprA n=1 Tax=Rhodoferax aquaticus TaxID=2527691 RepID=A0A515EK80_9BURK|nr:DNA-processing protein DprA [Rhodoferax aquaticus]QDL53058.1 DNA-protecting protein DprA [Rhodoferax aquaticus]
MERDELYSWLRLSLTPGVGNTKARALLSTFGLPSQVFLQSSASLCAVLSARQTDAVLQVPEGLDAQLKTTWGWLEEHRDTRRVLTLGDAAYPRSLLEMEDPPLILYAMGAPHAWEEDGLASCASRSIAVVGSRNPTAQGVANARQFSLALSQAGLTVVSGLALGVDGAAHEGALAGGSEAGISTIAVVGTGLDRVYPRQHLSLAHHIAQSGILLSEYPLGTPPLSANFPKRNRIIAGLTLGTLVVEAAMQSGSLITARLALEQGKDVFAIPGSIHSTQSRGCHALIKQGAKLVEGAQDVLEELRFERPSGTKTSLEVTDVGTSSRAGVSEPPAAPDEDVVLRALAYDPASLDLLQTRTGLSTADLLVRLMELELQCHVARVPGGLFQRVVTAQ